MNKENIGGRLKEYRNYLNRLCGEKRALYLKGGWFESVEFYQGMAAAYHMAVIFLDRDFADVIGSTIKS